MQVNPSKGGLIVRLVLILAVLAAAGVAVVHSLRETARVKAVNRDTAIDAVTGSVLVYRNELYEWVTPPVLEHSATPKEAADKVPLGMWAAARPRSPAD